MLVWWEEQQLGDAGIVWTVSVGEGEKRKRRGLNAEMEWVRALVIGRV